ncbi:hypothetical protein HPB50_024319 [Hyalomma asiaticum]|uniref:Uncharacterized protein n=1 Tax=Hyalomma asiaticum TaxID=266040 RepID=A0ACB7T8Q6_HYAAI|nr:hypothetical protein HPB50_024319 [Hyalomma asiaticum]
MPRSECSKEAGSAVEDVASDPLLNFSSTAADQCSKEAGSAVEDVASDPLLNFCSTAADQCSKEAGSAVEDVASDPLLNFSSTAADRCSESRNIPMGALLSTASLEARPGMEANGVEKGFMKTYRIFAGLTFSDTIPDVVAKLLIGGASFRGSFWPVSWLPLPCLESGFVRCGFVTSSHPVREQPEHRTRRPPE